MPTGTMCVSSIGDNSNDGRSWNYPKKDVVGAYDALPAGGGTILVEDSSYWDSANTDRGLWIVGPNDANYASPPTGYRQQKGQINVVGVPAYSAGITSGQCRILGGSGTDIQKPSLWLTGINSGFSISNVFLGYKARNVVIGIDPVTPASRSVNTSNLHFDKCTFEMNQLSTNGPVVDVGYAFWFWFKNCSFGSNFATYAITAASITAGTTARFTIGSGHRVRVGEVMRVAGVTPSGYNGDWTVTAVAATTFDADIGTSPASGSSFGTVLPFQSEQRASINLRSSSANAGLMYVEDCVFSMGNIRQEVSTATGSGNIVVRNTSWEADFVSTIPEPVYLKSVTKDTIGVIVDTVAVSDAGGTQSPYSLYAVLGSGQNVRPGWAKVTNSGQAFGPGIISDGYANRMAPQQTGFGWPNKVFGDHDAHRAAFAPTVARWVNRVSDDLTTWTQVGGATLVTGVAGPDGSTNALRVTSDGSGVDMARGAVGSRTYTAGDYVIAGAWMRAEDGQWAGYATANELYEFSSGGLVFAPHTSRRMYVKGDDKAWSWNVALWKVTTGGTNAANLDIYTIGTLSTEIFAPVVFHIPAADFATDYEAYRVLDTIAPVVTTAGAGDIALLRDHSLHVPKGHVEMVEVTDPTAPSTNRGRLYVRDNGSGKSQLVVRFPTGAIQVIATEP